MMPIMDGYTATKLIRENDFFKSTPIIALSANSNENEREKCLMVGCDDFVEKPIDLNTLSEIIKKYI
jgi:CheY-like chemotaxis protein